MANMNKKINRNQKTKKGGGGGGQTVERLKKKKIISKNWSLSEYCKASHFFFCKFLCIFGCPMGKDWP
jgi:hypothetical protein